MHTDIWTVVSNGRLVGRFPEPQLVHWVVTGQVNPNDLFYRDGMRVAAPAHSVEPFAAYFPRFAPGHVMVAPPRKLGDDPAMRWILPVGRSGWAIAAGYLGLFSVLGVFGPFAIVAGLLGINEINRKPGLHGLGRAIFGIVAGTIATIVLVAVLVTR